MVHCGLKTWCKFHSTDPNKCITLTLEDDKWIKGIVNSKTTDVPAMMNSEPQDSQKIIQDSFSNLGLNLVYRVFHKPQQQIKETEEKKIKECMHGNYQDTLNVLAIYRGGEAKKLEAFEEVSFNPENNETEDYFWYITEGRTERPLWVHNVDKRQKNQQSKALIDALPA
jgi:hypothetical protein